MPTTMGGKVMSAIATSLNTNPHASVGVDAATTAIHRFAEKFDRKAEAFFTYLQIFSAIFDSFAHGANDVANAVGPFATIFVVYSSGVVSSKADMGEHRYLILGLGGLGLGIGLLLWRLQDHARDRRQARCHHAGPWLLHRDGLVSRRHPRIVRRHSSIHNSLPGGRHHRRRTARGLEGVQ